jgi:glycosyltransferase involved in cell wall biosynthesis
MISIIVCSRQPESYTLHQSNVEKTIGCEYEYIRIDNTENKYGICAAYNKGMEQAKGDICVFVHEDCFFMEPGWGKILLNKFTTIPNLGLVGVAGTQYLTNKAAAWIAAGQPFIKGRVVHELDNNTRLILTAFSWNKEDAEVVAVDGLFFAIPKVLFSTIKFDDITFPGFHLYDLDISLQIHKMHKLIVTWDIMLKHFSGGVMSKEWQEAGKRFLEKYKDELPVSCVDGKPDTANYKGGMNFDLTGKIPLGVIA